ncbi:hypothetical protein [Saccharothrix deserti]|uniref:hypothetical protein n=1 Tax=Saccharothrix deserti TaxID=2593674 RepID=UPI00131C8F29|nr:hypothetical protein [Saccharothrix deserti]
MGVGFAVERWTFRWEVVEGRVGANLATGTTSRRGDGPRWLSSGRRPCWGEAAGVTGAASGWGRTTGGVSVVAVWTGVGNLGPVGSRAAVGGISGIGAPIPITGRTVGVSFRAVLRCTTGIGDGSACRWVAAGVWGSGLPCALWTTGGVGGGVDGALGVGRTTGAGGLVGARCTSGGAACVGVAGSLGLLRARWTTGDACVGVAGPLAVGRTTGVGVLGLSGFRWTTGWGACAGAAGVLCVGWVAGLPRGFRVSDDGVVCAFSAGGAGVAVSA